MKLVHVETLIQIGEFASSQDWLNIHDEVTRAIQGMVWPAGSDKFTIHPESGKKRRKGNGVKPIKNGLMKMLVKHGWKTEVALDIATVVRPGKLDAVFKTR